MDSAVCVSPARSSALQGSGGLEVPHGQGQGHRGGTLSNRRASHVPRSDSAGALDFEHIEEQAEGIFGGRKVYFQLPFLRAAGRGGVSSPALRGFSFTVYGGGSDLGSVGLLLSVTLGTQIGNGGLLEGVCVCFLPTAGRILRRFPQNARIKRFLNGGT